jgi:glycosyltransferase involved in cell wall biosynthesis
MSFEDLSVIIVTYNHVNYIEKCLNSFSSYKGLEIIVVDNNSIDGTPNFIEANFSSVNLSKAIITVVKGQE